MNQEGANQRAGCSCYRSYKLSLFKLQKVKQFETNKNDSDVFCKAISTILKRIDGLVVSAEMKNYTKEQSITSPQIGTQRLFTFFLLMERVCIRVEFLLDRG